MKQILTLSILLVSISVFAQQKNVAKETPATNRVEPIKAQSADAGVGSPRTAASSSQSRTAEPAPLPYNVDDRYMGRKEEFLGNLTVKELPADFPVYEKQWSLKEYNQVVTAFYYNHMDIVKENVKTKLAMLQH